MANETILIVEDEADIADLVRLHLAREGYRVLKAADGAEGLRVALSRRPELVILDLMLPEQNGVEVCRALRASESMRSCGIIMLTARDAESDVVLGLEMGADDYVAKPFSNRELMGRVRAVLRSRSRRDVERGSDCIEMGDVELDARRHELRVRGEPVTLTRMVFQKPNPFPMSIFENVVYPLRIDGERDKRVLEEACEKSLRGAGLWKEVKDRLADSALQLSGGQQQRLCIARAISAEPEVLLLDEPCSALDPIATGRIEDLIAELRGRYTILMVTHNMQQASRASDYTAFMYLGNLIEMGPTADIFLNPHLRETEDYVTGRFG